MALMEEDPKDVALALLLGWQRNETYGGPVWWRYCNDIIEYHREPTAFKATNRNMLCLVRPTAACCVARDTKQQITPEVTS